MKRGLSIILLATLFFVFSTAVFSQKKEHQTVSQVQLGEDNGRTLKRTVAIARFSNETMYSRGIFYDRENDPMAKQALDVLSARLASTGKFILLERSDLYNITENNWQSDDVKADYVIVGSITQFGRKNTGDATVFSRTKTQTVEVAVTIRLVDTSSGLIIYSEEGKGEAELKSKSTMGVGASADYDATLSDKAISAAISQLVENIVNNCMDRPWKAYFLTVDGSDIFISGGKTQGIAEGDTYIVKERGKVVKNPQTKLNMELPGKEVGKIKVLYTGGDTVESEFSLVSFVSGSFDSNNLTNYYIEEDKQ